MSTNRIGWWGLGGIMLLGLLSGCGKEGSKETATEVVRPVKLIQAAKAEPPVHRFASVIRASKSVDIAFPVPGQLDQLNVRDGMRVSEGQVLAQLNQRDFELKVDSAKAAYDLAEADFRRYEQLATTGAVSTATVDQARATYLTRKSQLEEAQKAFADTVLTAPFDGIIARRLVEQFANLQAKQPVIRLQARSPLEAVINVQESLVLGATPGESAQRMEAYLIFDGLPGVTIPAKYKEIQTDSDAVSQTYQVIFELTPSPDLLILPGMNATLVGLNLEHNNDAITVVVPPLAVVTDAQGETAVWVFNPHTTEVTLRSVTTGTLRSEGIVITAGVEPGESIVVAGISQLRPGMKVRPL